MYAIVRTGGKQYKVQPGDVLRIEKVEADLGAELDLTEVLAIGGDDLIVGEPMVKNARVTVVVTNQRKAPKVIIFKKKRRQGYRRLTGHRQLYTEVFVKAISGPGGTVTAKDKPAIYDPEKKIERDARKTEWAEKMRLENREAPAADEAGKAAAAKKSSKSGAKKKGAKKSTKTAKKATTTKKKA
jgi:large subunit ribosomal protein L21